jgi:hypothetical protein
VIPTLLSAVWSVPLLIANTGTDSEIGMYQMLLPLSELVWIAGPGAGKLIVGLLSWATTAWACATPAELDVPDLVAADDGLELPQAAASTAVPATAANVAARRERVVKARCRVISG